MVAIWLVLNPLLPKSDIDFALFNARRFYSSKGDPVGVKGLKACKKWQMPHHAGQERWAENAPPLGAIEDIPDEFVIE